MSKGILYRGNRASKILYRENEIVKALFNGEVVYERATPPAGDEFYLHLDEYTENSLDTKQWNIGTSDNYNLSLAYKELITLKSYKIKVAIASGENIDTIDNPIPIYFNGAWYQYRTLESPAINLTDTTLFDGAWHTITADRMFLINAFVNNDQDISECRINLSTAYQYNYPDIQVSLEILTNSSQYGTLHYTVKRYNDSTSAYDIDHCEIWIEDILVKTEHDIAGTLYGIADDSLTFSNTNIVNGTNYKGIAGTLPVLTSADSTKGSTALCEYDLQLESGYTNSNSTPIGLGYKRTDNGNLILHRGFKLNNASPKKGIVLTPSTIGTNKSAFALSVGKNFKAGSTTLTVSQMELEWDETLHQLKVYDIRSDRVLMGTFTITSLKVFIF